MLPARFIKVVLLCALLFVGALAPFLAPARAEAAACSGPNIAFGRQRWCGYFYNGIDTNGDSVISNGFPATVDTVQEFVAQVESWLDYGSPWQKTGAQFLILTMLGRSGGTPKNVTTQDRTDWEQNVGSYADISTSGGSSYGQNGRIDWNVTDHKPCDYFNGYYSSATRFNNFAALNTYYQAGDGAGPDDVAAFFDTDCYTTYLQPWQGPNPTASWQSFIYFRDTAGNIIYRIRRACANPIGQLGTLQKPQPKFNLTPNVGAKITSGGTPVNGNIAEAGDTITFSYSIQNSEAGASQPTTCTYKQATYTGNSSAPPGNSVVPSAPNWTNVTCPPALTIPGSSNPTVATEVVTGLADNTSICRSLTITPATPTGGSAVGQACVFVAAKPFAKVNGGDVKAGAGVVTSSGLCSSNNGAAIIGWNKENSPNYDGAGVQYAAYALNTILDMATSAGSGSGVAATPTGLSFANTSANAATGAFGGSFGSVPCISNYYGELPATYNTINAPTTSAALPNGTSFRNGDLQVTGGTINAGNRVSLFVKGNVYISAPILYGGSGSWNTDTIPLFQLIVSGNIYIAPGVTQLDGLYVAQSADGATNGVIYTCATGLGAPVALTSLSGSCGTSLTVYGAFVARQVQLMRAAGSLGNGTPAEVFNYNPALWMAQPSGLLVSPAQYDSIASLPPVL